MRAERSTRLARRLGTIRAASLLVCLAGLHAPGAEAQTAPPILFVHGNGDSAASWYTTLWRFESNGYDKALLFAADLPHPSARRYDSVFEENRSSTTDAAAELAAAVTRVLIATRQPQLVLVGSSRAGNTIRNYVKNGGGAAHVSLAILCGATAHGVFLSERETDSEWNGRGAFITGLNAGGEVPRGVAFVTLRSDSNDKYAQTAGPFIPKGDGIVGAGPAGPALEGARNVVLDGLDHREVAFHPRAFREMFRAITGREPERLDVAPEAQPLLDGVVSGYLNGAATNLPVAGATLEVYEVDPKTGTRLGQAVHHKLTTGDGRWGPFQASPTAYYEFVVASAGTPTLHVYRTPFPRGSRYVHFRLQPIDDADREAGAIVVLQRTRGYIGVARDTFLIDGRVPDGIVAGVPGTASAKMRFPAAPSAPVSVVLNQEALTVRTYPRAEGHLVIAEFHY